MSGRLVVLPILLSMTLTVAAQRQPAQKQADYCAASATRPPTLPAVLMEGIGKSNFPITTSSADAQKFFNQGVAQMHSFWFQEAERSFMQAAALDPNAAMAYWGIAVSTAGDYRPAFQLLSNRSNLGEPPPPGGTPLYRANQAIAKAMGLRAKVSARERLYIEAVAARRAANARDPDGDYIRALRKVVTSYPNDLEAKAILALALEQGYAPDTKEPREGTLESLGLLKEILAKDPDQVAANHYIIHAYEGSKEPAAAWKSCQRYPELVPKIPHALHMPGHIYVQSGRMGDALRAFTATAAKEREYMARDVLYDDGHFVHNQLFLIHVLGIQGRYREAIARAKEILQIKENPAERAVIDIPSSYRLGWWALMKTLVRFEKWDAILDGKSLLSMIGLESAPGFTSLAVSPTRQRAM